MTLFSSSLVSSHHLPHRHHLCTASSCPARSSPVSCLSPGFLYAVVASEGRLQFSALVVRPPSLNSSSCTILRTSSSFNVLHRQAALINLLCRMVFVVRHCFYCQRLSCVQSCNETSASSQSFLWGMLALMGGQADMSTDPAIGAAAVWA